MGQITKKQIVKYAVMPGFRPRVQELIGSGFKYIPFFIAIVYQAVRLLPAHHPYVNSRNIGRFGITHVIAEAANNLVFSRKNIDQIILFATILLGLVLVSTQIVMLVFSIFVQPVMAQVVMPTNFAGFFVTGDASLPLDQRAPQDLAFIMMDLVFGIPDLFYSCVSTNVDCVLDPTSPDTSTDNLEDPWGHIAGASGANWPFPIHEALHEMFRIYNTGLLVVATFITLYFMGVVVAETAQTGTAFGKRFNKVWAPIRIVVAFGLLVPVGHGLNSSQYVVLYAAKYGSGFASNGWALFNDALLGAYFRQADRLVTRPNPPEVSELLQFLYTAKICEEMEAGQNTDRTRITPHLVGDPKSASPSINISDYLDRNFTGAEFRSSYDAMLDFANGSSKISLVFGRKHKNPGTANIEPSNYPNEIGGVDPVCGSITFSLQDPREPVPATGTAPEIKPEPAADLMQRYYWYAVMELWYDVFYGNPPGGALAGYTENYAYNTACTILGFDSCPVATATTAGPILPPNKFRDDVQKFYKDDLDAMLDGPAAAGGGLDTLLPAPVGIVTAQALSDKWLNQDAPLLDKGWAAAGLWYNKVAELNGTISAATESPPTVNKWPAVMEKVLTEKLQNAQNIQLGERFDPTSSGKQIQYKNEYDQKFAEAMWKGFSFWKDDGLGGKSPQGNAFIDTLHALLGTEGLFNIRKNPDAHPLALLVGVGRSFINAAIGNLLDATTLAALSAAIGGSEGVAILISFVMTLITTSLTAGFILFYVVPFLPFIYFFFAVGGWVKGIFEAMVGAPLWALAHIRIDGNGLAGQAAVNGYFLIFEIFLRPILIVFGMLASISIFSALVSVMNQTWDLVTSNLAGYDTTNSGAYSVDIIQFTRGPVDAFFFTIIYTIIVYLMAMSSFKLIDLIPNNILRWMGQSVATFNDQRDDPAQGLVGTATVGAQQGISSIGQGASGALGGLAKGGG